VGGQARGGSPEGLRGDVKSWEKESPPPVARRRRHATSWLLDFVTAGDTRDSLSRRFRLGHYDAFTKMAPSRKIKKVFCLVYSYVLLHSDFSCLFIHPYSLKLLK